MLAPSVALLLVLWMHGLFLYIAKLFLYGVVITVFYNKSDITLAFLDTTCGAQFIDKTVLQGDITLNNNKMIFVKRWSLLRGDY